MSTDVEQLDDAGAQEPAAASARRRSPARTIDPLASWRRHRGRMPLIALIVMLLGAPVAWKLGAPRFHAEAALRVSPTYVENLKQDDADIQLASTTQYQQFVQQQATTLRSFDVATAALQRLGDRRSLWQKPGESDRRAAERLMAALLVQPVRDTYLITVALEGATPDGLSEIVNTVTEEYVVRSGEEGIYGPDQRVETLRTRREQLQQEIDGDVARIAALSSELGVSTFEDTHLNPVDSALVGTGQALTEWRRKRIAAEAKLAALDQALEREKNLEIDTAAQDVLERSQALTSATRLYFDRRDQLLAQRSGLATGHPGYAAIQRQLDEVEAELQRVTGAEVAAAKATIQKQRATRAASERSRIAMEVDEARAVEGRLVQDYDEQQARLGDYTTRYQSALELTAGVRRARKQVEAIDNRIDSFTLEAHAPGFVRIASPARPAESPISGGRRKLLIIVGLASLAAALAAPIVLDRLDPHVVLPGDVETALGMPPLAWIADRSTAQTRDLAADQLRRLALSLARDRDRNGTGVVALTAVRGGAGTSSLVLELAGLLRRAGTRTLAIDANPLSADARYAGEGAATLADLLSGACTIDEAVVAGDASLPDRIALGTMSEGELLAAQPALRATLAALAQRYDLLLLDAPPVLASSEAELLAQLADAVLLVVPASAATPNDTRAAATVLERIAPAAFGAVLTGVRVSSHASALRHAIGRDRAAARRPLLQRWLWA